VLDKIELVRKALYQCFPDQKQSNVDELLLKDKSIQFALEYLRPGEIPERTTVVSLAIPPGGRQFGFVWLTNRRLFFAGAVGGLLMKIRPVYREYPYQDISAVEFEKSRSFRSARIILRGTATPRHKQLALFESIVNNEQLQTFVDALQYKLAHPGSPAVGETNELADEATSLPNSEFIEGLERLSKLRSQGALTDAEFEAAKRKLLDL
jgi:hypothetical protein